MESRGIRNNNPGNIRWTAKDHWRGTVGQDEDGYLKFESPEMGIRAMAIVLRNYGVLHDLHTVKDIITRWAPPEENDTASYIAAVSKALGTSPTQVLRLNGTLLFLLLRAIIHHENGKDIYSDAQLVNGIAEAGSL